MQEGLLSLRHYQLQLVLQQVGGIAFSQMIGVRAHGTHFGIVGHMQALAGHGGEGTVYKNAVVAAKLNGAGVKGAGPGEAGKRYHGRYVFGLQRYDGMPERVELQLLVHKLQSRYMMSNLPTPGHVFQWLGAGKQDPAPGRHQVVQLIKTRCISAVEPCIGRHFLREIFYLIIAQCKMAVAGKQGIVNRIV